MTCTLRDIAGMLHTTVRTGEGTPISQLLTDSRKLQSPATTLFFALNSPQRDGHQFIADLYKKQVRCFVVAADVDETKFPGAVFLKVPDTLAALQQLAATYRRRFSLPVVAITGSNGKTIVKEWLWHLLHQQRNIVRSPKSYNSQTGVPLSVWQINEQHDLALLEAGISQPGEMEKLEKIIQPSIGILTNIGDAHNEGFKDKAEKIKEKLKLFVHCSTVLGREEDLAALREEIAAFPGKPAVLTWGYGAGNALVVNRIEVKENLAVITYTWSGAACTVSTPFTDQAAVENTLLCCLACHHLAGEQQGWMEKISSLPAINMRLEVKKGINQCIIINDSYSADLTSLEIALNFLDHQPAHPRKTVILSDFLQSGEPDETLYAAILELAQKHGISRLIGIGPRISHTLAAADAGGLQVELFSGTGDFISRFLSSRFRDEVVLVKGARSFGFEEIVQLLEQKVHQTLLEINLAAVVHNVKVYQRHLQPGTKLMAMVKAFAYGSGGAEIAGILQFHKVDYLAVAYADEGVELRKAGITLPVMVMNVEETAFDAITAYNLEPDIYSFSLLRAFENFLQKEGLENFPVHVEIETGMNRLGFALAEIPALALHLADTSLLKVQTVFSHLASSDDADDDAYTLQQFDRFMQGADILKKHLPYPFLQHIANSAAILRLPRLQLDMVRLGIGMYGIDSSGAYQSLLQPAATLRSTIAQLKQLKAGESVSYNRKGILARDSVIATVRIGYADGFSRRFGYGTACMLVRGKKAPVVGTVCMDMTMIDVTDIAGVQEGDEVIIFGKDLPVQQLAAWAGTIPYEIMTGISQRVKRVYFEE